MIGALSLTATGNTCRDQARDSRQWQHCLPETLGLWGQGLMKVMLTPCYDPIHVSQSLQRGAEKLGGQRGLRKGHARQWGAGLR